MSQITAEKEDFFSKVLAAQRTVWANGEGTGIDDLKRARLPKSKRTAEEIWKVGLTYEDKKKFVNSRAYAGYIGAFDAARTRYAALPQSQKQRLRADFERLQADYDEIMKIVKSWKVLSSTPSKKSGEKTANDIGQSRAAEGKKDTPADSQPSGSGGGRASGDLASKPSAVQAPLIAENPFIFKKLTPTKNKHELGLRGGASFYPGSGPASYPIAAYYSYIPLNLGLSGSTSIGAHQHTTFMGGLTKTLFEILEVGWFFGPQSKPSLSSIYSPIGIGARITGGKVMPAFGGSGIVGMAYGAAEGGLMGQIIVGVNAAYSIVVGLIQLFTPTRRISKDEKAILPEEIVDKLYTEKQKSFGLQERRALERQLQRGDLPPETRTEIRIILDGAQLGASGSPLGAASRFLPVKVKQYAIGWVGWRYNGLLLLLQSIYNLIPIHAKEDLVMEGIRRRVESAMADNNRLLSKPASSLSEAELKRLSANLAYMQYYYNQENECHILGDGLFSKMDKSLKEKGPLYSMAMARMLMLEDSKLDLRMSDNEVQLRKNAIALIDHKNFLRSLGENAGQEARECIAKIGAHLQDVNAKLKLVKKGIEEQYNETFPAISDAAGIMEKLANAGRDWGDLQRVELLVQLWRLQRDFNIGEFCSNSAPLANYLGVSMAKYQKAAVSSSKYARDSLQSELRKPPEKANADRMSNAASFLAMMSRIYPETVGAGVCGRHASESAKEIIEHNVAKLKEKKKLSAEEQKYLAFVGKLYAYGLFQLEDGYKDSLILKSASELAVAANR